MGFSPDDHFDSIYGTYKSLIFSKFKNVHEGIL